VTSSGKPERRSPEKAAAFGFLLALFAEITLLV
jgi:hypothetical protein